MSEKKKSKLGCVLGCLGLSLVGVGAGVVLFGGLGAAGVAWFALGSSEMPTESLADVLPTPEEVGEDSDAMDAAPEDEPEAAPPEDEVQPEELGEAEDEPADAVADAEPVASSPSGSRTSISGSRTSISGSRSSSSSSSPSSSSGSSRVRPSTSSSTSGTSSVRPSSSSTTTTPDTTTSSSGTSTDYDFPDPEPERPSTKVDYPPLYEEKPNHSSSWNVRAEGEVTDIRLAVEAGSGTYPVPSLVPEDKYIIEANFGDGRFIEAGKITVKEGSRYFIQCKPSRQKCSVR